MPIKGFQGTSLLDYPGSIASLIFWGGCNLACPFCHNPALVVDQEQLPDYPVDVLLADLHSRRSFVDGVVVSGGEPTLDPDLPGILRSIKELGLLVKLDTNGLRPDVLEDLLAEKLLDYVALDLKTSPARYDELGARGGGENLKQSIELLLHAPMDYEFRTTCAPGLVGAEELSELGRYVSGGRIWVLQQFQPGPSLDPCWREKDPYPVETIRGFGDLIQPYVEEVVLRGI